jgi:hypothetical protein
MLHAGSSSRALAFYRMSLNLLDKFDADGVRGTIRG